MASGKLSKSWVEIFGRKLAGTKIISGDTNWIFEMLGWKHDGRAK